jgi:hypothetical protein
MQDCGLLRPYLDLDSSPVKRAQARAELELLSPCFHLEHSLEANGIVLTDTTLFSHPGGRERSRAIMPRFSERRYPRR